MELPVDLLHWALAFLPILILAFLLVQLRWTAQQAGAAGIFVAAAVAFFVFRAPLETLAVAGAKGVWDAAFILLVIWARSAALSDHESGRRLRRPATGHHAITMRFCSRRFPSE